MDYFQFSIYLVWLWAHLRFTIHWRLSVPLSYLRSDSSVSSHCETQQWRIRTTLSRQSSLRSMRLRKALSLLRNGLCSTGCSPCYICQKRANGPLDRRHAERTAQLWLQKLRDSPAPKRLNLIYLANGNFTLRDSAAEANPDQRLHSSHGLVGRRISSLPFRQ